MLAFGHIPSTVNDLNLSDNGLSEKTNTEIAKILAAIPSTVKTLDLSNNSLENKTDAELTELFKMIPKTLNIIHWGNHKLKISFENSQKDQTSLPLYVGVASLVGIASFLIGTGLFRTIQGNNQSDLPNLSHSPL